MKRWVQLAIVLVVFFLDQLTKELILENLAHGESLVVIPNYFNLTLVFNPGAAFGIFSTWPETYRIIALSLVTLIAFGVVIWFLFVDAKDDVPSQVALCAIMGGAFGNIIDRFRFGAVVDFLDFYVNDYHWPAFNIADSAISVSVFILLVRVMFCSKKEAQEALD